MNGSQGRWAHPLQGARRAWKSIFWICSAAGVVLWLAACADSAPPPVEDPAAKQALEQTFLHFREKIQAGQGDSLPKYLSQATLNWLDDMRRASRTEAPQYLQQRPFFEILCILALRIQRRIEPTFDDRPPSLLKKLVIDNYPVRKTILKSDMASPVLFGETAEMGLREAPNVPVFRFSREHGEWKFHLHESLPLILRGAESLARQRKSTPYDQAVLVLEQFGGQRVLPEDTIR